MSAADLEQSRRRVLKAAEGQPWAGDLALLLAELDERRELAEAVDTEWRTTGKGECALCHGTHYYSQPMIAVPGKTVNTICPYCGPPPRLDADSSGAEREVRRLELAPVPDESPVLHLEAAADLEGSRLPAAEPGAPRFEVVDMEHLNTAGEFERWSVAKLAAHRQMMDTGAAPGRFLVRPIGWAKQHKMDARQR